MKRIIVLLAAATLVSACGQKHEGVITKKVGKKENQATKNKISEKVTVTDEAGISVKYENENTKKVVLLVTIESDKKEQGDLLFFIGQIMRDMTAEDLKHPSVEEKTFSGQILAEDASDISADLHCPEENCAQLYAVIKREGQDKAISSFVFHKREAIGTVVDPSQAEEIDTWDLKIAMTSGLEDISSARELVSYIKEDVDAEADSLGGILPTGKEDDNTVQDASYNPKPNADETFVGTDFFDDTIIPDAEKKEGDAKVTGNLFDGVLASGQPQSVPQGEEEDRSIDDSDEGLLKKASQIRNYLRMMTPPHWRGFLFCVLSVFS